MAENILKLPTDVSNTTTASLAFYDSMKDVLASNSSDPLQNTKIVNAVNSGQQLVNTVTDIINDSGLSSGGLAIFGVSTSLVAVTADLNIINSDYSQGVTGIKLQSDLLTLGVDLFGFAGSVSTAFAVFQPESAEITLPLAFIAATTGGALQIVKDNLPEEQGSGGSLIPVVPLPDFELIDPTPLQIQQIQDVDIQILPEANAGENITTGMNGSAYSSVATNSQTGVQTATVANTASQISLPDTVTGSNLTNDSFNTVSNRLSINASNAQVQVAAGSSVALTGINNNIQTQSGPGTTAVQFTNGGIGDTLTFPNQSPLLLAGATDAIFDNNITTLYYGSSPNSPAPPGATSVVVNLNNATGTGTAVATAPNGQTTNTTIDNSADLNDSIANAFGSSLGHVLAGNNPLAQIVVSTTLGTALQGVAQLLEQPGNIDLAQNYSNVLSLFPQEIKSAGAGALASLLTADLIDAAGITGLPAAVLNTVAGHVVSTIAVNLVTPSAHTFDNIGNIGSWELIGAQFVGSEVANAIYQPDTVAGQEGATVLTSIDSAYQAFSVLENPELLSDPYFFAAVVVAAILDDLLGGVIGDLFGQPSTSHIAEANFTANGSNGTALSFSFGTSLYQGGPIDDATGAGEAVVGALNNVLKAVGGTVLDVSSLTNFGVGFNTDAAAGYDSKGNNDAAGMAYYYFDNTAGTNPQYWAAQTTLQTVVDYAVLRELSEMAFAGGDPYMERAIDATLRSSIAPTTQALAGNIQIAQDYEFYEANKATINALIASNPTSETAQFWIGATALAGSMGYGTSVQGGTDNDTLNAGGTQKILIGGGGDDTYVDTTGDGQVTILNGVSYNNIAVGILQLNEQGLYYDANEHDTSGNGLTNLTFTQRGADLVIGLNGSTTDGVTLEGWFAGSFAEIGQISLANGTIIDLAAIQGYVGQESEELISPNHYAKFATDNIGIENANSFTNSGAPIAGGNGDDVLVGGSGANTFITGGGIDIAYGGGGSDTYQFNGVGLLAIYNNINDSGAVMGTAASGTLNLGGGATANQLGFSRNGNDLDITLSGLGSAVTVKNWFASAYAQLSDITTSDGNTIYYSTSGGGEFWYEDTAFPYGIHSYVFWNVAGLFISQEYYYDADGNNYETATQNTATLWTYGLEANIHISIGIDGDTFNVTAAGTDTVSFAASNATLSLTGSSGDTINVTSGSSDVINASNDTINLAAGVSATINGGGNVVTSGAGSSTTIYDNGGGNTVNLTANSSSTVVVSTNSNATVTGAGNTVDLSGPGNTLFASGETVNLAANALAVFSGANNAIYAAAGDTIEITSGAGNVIYANNDTIALSAGISATINGGGNVVTSGAGSSTTIYDNGGGNTVNLTANSGSTVVVSTNSNATVTGAGNTVNLSGPGNSVYTSGETVNLVANAGAVVNGDSNTIDATTGNTIWINSGSGDVINAIGDTINLAAGVSATVDGYNNTVTSGAGSNTTIYDNGASNTVNLTANSGAMVIISTNSNATVTGAGNTVALSGPGNTLNASGETVNLAANSLAVFNGNSNTIKGNTGDTIEIASGTGNVINAIGDTIILAASVSATINGYGNTVTSGAGSNTTIYDNGASNTVNLTANSGATVIVSTNSNATVTGAGNTVDLSGPGNSVYTSGETINLVANAGAVVNGNSNTIEATTGDTIWINSGAGDVINAIGDTIILAAGVSVTIAGGSDTITAAASSSVTLSATNGQADTVNATGAAVVVGSGVQATIGYLSSGTIGQLSFSDRLAASQAIFSQSGNDLVITFIGSTAAVRVSGWFLNQSYRPQYISYSDGSQISASAISGLLGDTFTAAVLNGTYDGGQLSSYDSLAQTGYPAAIDGTTTAVGGGEDFFGTGQKDVFLRTANQQLSVWQFNAAGQLTGRLWLTVNGNPFTIDSATMVVGAEEDFFGAGQADIFLRTASGQLSVWQLNSSGQCTAGLWLTVNGNPFTIDSTTTVVGAGEDFFGAGQRDIFLRTGSGQLSVWQLNSSGQYTGNLWLTVNGNPFEIDSTTTVVGAGEDFIGAGQRDVFLRSGLGQLSIWQLNGSGQYTAGLWLTRTDGTAFTIDAGSTVVGAGEDFFGTGERDIIVRSVSGQISVWEFNSNWQEDNSQALTFNGGPTVFDPSATVVGATTNYFGGGERDVFFRTGSGQLEVWYFDNLGQLDGAQALTFNGGPTAFDPSATVVGTTTNYFGGGERDVFFRTGAGQLEVWYFNTLGQLGGAQSLTFNGGPTAFDPAARVIGFGTNMFGAGERDLFYRAGSGQLVTWLFNNSGQLIGALSFTNADGTPFIVSGSTTVLASGHDSTNGLTAIKLQVNGQSINYDLSGSALTAAPSGALLDPLVLNLTGGAIQTTAEASSGVTFDMRGDGGVQQTGWITQGEGFLVADPTGAPIVSRAQMFSDLLVPGATSGLAALAAYDTNGDGKITAADADFKDIAVWIPGANGGGGVLDTLSQLGIVEIDLQKTAIDAMNNGNEILNGFSFKYASGASGNGAEVGFAASPDLGSSSDTTLAQLIQAMASLPTGSATLNPAESAVSNDNPAWHLATIAAAMH